MKPQGECSPHNKFRHALIVGIFLFKILWKKLFTFSMIMSQPQILRSKLFFDLGDECDTEYIGE